MRIPFFIIFALLICSCARDQHKFSVHHRDNIAIYTEIEQFGEQFAASHNMHLLFVGNCTNSLLIGYSMLLNSSQPINLQEGRVLAKSLMAQFLPMIRSSSNVQNYIDNIRKSGYSRSDVVPLKEIGFRIDFWDENTERIVAPYLGQIMVEGKDFYYYEADPETLKLRLVYQEEYQE